MTLTSGRLPDYLVIGAQRAGTTTFYALLRMHPLIDRAQRKELHFFDRDYEKGEAYYRSLFPPRTTINGRPTITGEATPYYLYHPLVAQRAHALVPHAKLFVLLRNPVDRAYSHWRFQVARGNETLSFEEAIDAEEGRLAREDPDGYAHRRFSYQARGIYAPQLARWMELFGMEALRIFKAEAFFKRTDNVLRRAQRHLGVPVRRLPLSGRPAQRNSTGEHPPMNPKTRRKLTDYFRPYNEELYEMLGRDFGW